MNRQSPLQVAYRHDRGANSEIQPVECFRRLRPSQRKTKIWKCGRNVLGEYSDTTYEDIFSYEPIFVNKYLRKRFAKTLIITIIHILKKSLN